MTPVESLPASITRGGVLGVDILFRGVVSMPESIIWVKWLLRLKGEPNMLSQREVSRKSKLHRLLLKENSTRVAFMKSFHFDAERRQNNDNKAQLILWR